MKILFVASESLPFSKTGGLADVIEALPRALVALGHRVAVLIPRYRNTDPVAPPVTPTVPSLTIPFGDALRFPAISEATSPRRVRYYFVEDPEYFDREGLYGVSGKDYADNAERFAELSRAAIEFSKVVGKPDVIHCHDWQSALVPVLLRTQYANDPAFRTVPTVFTIHNMGYQGLFPPETLQSVGAPETLFRMDAMEFHGKVNFLKGGLNFADYLTTVSPKYAQEIQTTEYGWGLDGVLRDRADRLFGILNGVDYGVWNPAKDHLIAAKYSPKDLSGKFLCKKDVLETFGLPPERADKPLIGIVSRFAGQKGFDLIEEIAADLLDEDVTIVALGAGEPKYEKMFRELAALAPAKVAVKIAYDDTLAHKIEAGADMFLMPSRYEPCGLNQMYSLKYGTVPVVHATGGLEDTVQEFDSPAGQGTGFKFRPYGGEALLGAIRHALDAYRNQLAWRQIQLNGMAKDFSWRASAIEYVKLYELARNERNRTEVVTSN